MLIFFKLKQLLSKQPRKPVSNAEILAFPDGVMIYTKDGNVLLTANFMRQILPKLSYAANEAAKHLSE